MIPATLPATGGSAVDPWPGSAVPCLVGPTAVGKSAVALALAERLGGEIVSVDSMQVYRGLDLGTAKPDAAERARVEHHLVDVAGLDESFDAARFCTLASRAVTEIRSRGRVPILCGGTGFYFKAFFEGLGDAPPTDPELRRLLEAAPLPVLLAELAVSDPEAWERIDRQNPRRVVRAVEVVRLTGRPFFRPRVSVAGVGGVGTPLLVGLQRTSADLGERIAARVDAMFAAGLVAETRELLAHGLAGNPTAMQAIGYRQVVEHLRGERSLAETVELVKIRTRQFARRQMTWFRRQMPVRWVPAGEEGVAATAGRVLEAWRNSGALGDPGA